MASPKRDTSLGTGVYYAAEDYVGISRRLIILVVDLIVLILAFIVVGSLYFGITNNEPTDTVYIIYFGLTWAYMTILKASPVRTVGYRLTGARVVTLHGARPSVFRMTFRFLLWLLGPFNLIFDLFWAGTDEDRQTLRDRFSGTCVVNNLAKPAGTGEVHISYYNALGMTLMYPRVARPKASSPAK